MRDIQKRLFRCLIGLSILGAFLFSVPVVGATDGIVAFKVLQPYPQQYSTETIAVRLGDTNRVPLVGLAVHSVWNYRTVTSEADATTDTNGYAYLSRNIGDATCGFTVRVDIFVWWDSTWSQVDSQFFTPCYDADAHARDIVNHAGDALYPPYDPAQAQATYDAILAGGSQNIAPRGSVSAGPVSGSYGVCPAGYPVKGNDNSGIYHVPGGQFYDATNARNCFATEGAAQAAGYRASNV